MAKLTFVLEDGQEVVVPLKEHTTIGRAEDNDILVDDERISPHHAEIMQNADGSLQVFDLKSATGTFINGENQLSCTLLHGDTIAFGPLVGKLDMEDLASLAPSPPPSIPIPPPAAAPAADAPPAPAEAAPDKALVDANAKLEAEKKRLKSEVASVEKELRDWQQRAEKERALHLSRVESLLAEQKRLEPTKAAVKQAEGAHQEWLDAISALSTQHADKTAALERLNSQHYEKSTEFQRLSSAVTSAQQELAALAVQKDESAARLHQIRDECQQDEALLNSLRLQIIEHEKRIAEEEARHAELNAATQALSARHQRDEAAVKDLQSLLSGLEQRCAAAEAALQRSQQENTAVEKSLAARKTELATCEKAVAAQKAESEAEARRIAEARAQRAELESQNQDLAAAKQQLADARQRLAAVEQRYRDTLAVSGQNGTQMAVPPRRQSPQDAPASDPGLKTQHDELIGRIEAARKELAGLEARITTLQQSPPAAEDQPSSAPPSFPPPFVVQVETIRIAPVPIKSERTRGPGAKKSARPV